MIAKASTITDHAKEWFITNKLTMNKDKNQNFLITFKERIFENPRYVKFLSFYVDSTLKRDQLAALLIKTNFMYHFLLKNLRNSANTSILRIAFPVTYYLWTIGVGQFLSR